MDKDPEEALSSLATPLRTERSRSDDRDSPVDIGKAFTVSCLGRYADARIDADGSFEAVPRSNDEDSRSCRTCAPSEADRHLQVDGADIVGATLEEDSGFRVWHAPISNPNGKCKFRKLAKTEVRECATREEAERTVDLLRQANCWWGRPSPPRLVIFVNPVSGPGRSRSIWGEVRSVLEAAGLQLTVVETSRRLHAKEAAQNLDLAGCDALACVGGDGTVSEVIQGLFEREDWQQAIAVPLCHIPGGTGNGLAASSGLWTPLTAAHALIKGRRRQLDIVSMLQPPGRRYFSFLSLTYGLIANVDIGTENLRWMGTFRNQIGALKEILKSGEYFANVAVLPATAVDSGTKTLNPTSTPHLDALGPLDAFPALPAAQLPEGWRRVERSSFSILTVSVLPWLATDFSLVPGETVDSGEMTLTHLPGKLARLESLSCLLKAEAGKISEVAKVGEEKIAAFVIEPTKPGTWMVMDGEVIPFERVFAELHPGICSVIVAP